MDNAVRDTHFCIGFVIVNNFCNIRSGDNGEPVFWSMVKYALEVGSDALYRSIILRCLGEVGAAAMNEFDRSEDNKLLRDVTSHCKTVTEIVLHVKNEQNDVTLQQLITMWRAKKGALPW